MLGTQGPGDGAMEHLHTGDLLRWGQDPGLCVNFIEVL